MKARTAESDSIRAFEDAILALCKTNAAVRTICPTDAARAYPTSRGERELGLRPILRTKRRGAAGHLSQRRAFDPYDFRGRYRL
jgi:uncharacterized protein DUF3253